MQPVRKGHATHTGAKLSSDSQRLQGLAVLAPPAPAIMLVILAGQQSRCMSLLWFEPNPPPAVWMAQREVIAAFDR